MAGSGSRTLHTSPAHDPKEPGDTLDTRAHCNYIRAQHWPPRRDKRHTSSWAARHIQKHKEAARAMVTFNRARTCMERDSNNMDASWRAWRYFCALHKLIFAARALSSDVQLLCCHTPLRPLCAGWRANRKHFFFRCPNALDDLTSRLVVGTPRQHEVLRPQIHRIAWPRATPKVIIGRSRNLCRARDHEICRPRAPERVTSVHRADGERRAAARAPSHTLRATETVGERAHRHRFRAA